MRAREARTTVATTELESCGVHHASPELHHVNDCSLAYCGRGWQVDALQELLAHCREATDDPQDLNEPYAYVTARLEAILNQSAGEEV